MTYARARLWLGMTTVGTLVAASSVSLYLELPQAVLGGVPASLIAQAAALAGFVMVYAALHLISDVFGAVVIPRAHGRLDESVGRVLTRLAKGVAAHSVILWGVTVAVLLAGRALGLPGVLAASAGIAASLLVLRPHLARAIGQVMRVRDDAGLCDSPDRGFTGGIDGVFKPGVITVPKAWRDSLSNTELNRVLERRRSAVANGSWLKGRLLAISFTLVGVAVAGLLAGPETLGSAAGVVRLSLWFTLWSFLGLLTLPTLSRHAVTAADRDAGLDETAVTALGSLDRLGDDEPNRPRLIETIFHPVPSLQERGSSRPLRGVGYWDVARTALFLSSGGLGLLGRAVHCNAGRPALWVYLPSA